MRVTRAVAGLARAPCPGRSVRTSPSGHRACSDPTSGLVPPSQIETGVGGRVRGSSELARGSLWLDSLELGFLHTPRYKQAGF